MSGKRHKKPTAVQLVARMYRLRLEDRTQLDQIQRAIGEFISIWNTAMGEVSDRLHKENRALRERCDKQDQQMDRLIGLMHQLTERERYPLTAAADHLERVRRQHVAAAWNDANEFIAKPLKVPTLRTP